jgi:hypothetical protein
MPLLEDSERLNTLGGTCAAGGSSPERALADRSRRCRLSREPQVAGQVPGKSKKQARA